MYLISQGLFSVSVRPANLASNATLIFDFFLFYIIANLTTNRNHILTNSFTLIYKAIIIPSLRISINRNNSFFRIPSRSSTKQIYDHFSSDILNIQPLLKLSILLAICQLQLNPDTKHVFYPQFHTSYQDFPYIIIFIFTHYHYLLYSLLYPLFYPFRYVPSANIHECRIFLQHSAFLHQLPVLSPVQPVFGTPPQDRSETAPAYWG